MKFKRWLGICSVLVLLAACKGNTEDPVPSNAFGLATGRAFYPFGKYELLSYENNRKPDFPARLDILNEIDKEGHFILNGRAAVNFFFAKFDADFAQKTMKIYGIGVTEIAANRSERNFEKDMLERLSKVERYSFNEDGTKITLYLPKGDNKSLVFKVITD